ncbi:protein transport protein bos1 [Apophysomyces ossiformis]|uniref:Protein transport protein BOS1 n=1 Tax=Apophysomyces ossiformis TaxID=679940 RepID=A0A8H7BPY4_9FUNG|nr:protein transport protein bos1 [Apophysomyces ossiformis]
MAGQISAAFNSLQRSIDDYENLAKREMIAVKKETALTRASKFRSDLQESKIRFETIKKQRENQRHEQNRETLLRRANKTSSAPEHPYQPISRQDYLMREHAFAESTESQLDDYILQAQNILENLTDQHGILKKTQRKILDAANTLGLSQNVIRYIERRTAQDKWIFIVGLIVTILIMWAIVHYLG